MCEVVTPLKLQAWQEALTDHPDTDFSGYILRGIQTGFRIGFDAGLVSLRSRQGNLASVSDQPEVVEKYLHEEIQANRLIRVHQADLEALSIQCSPFGVIPKKNKPNKFRLIIDLSSPTGHSVNDGIGRELATLSYISVDDVVTGILQLGQGSMMAKMDIRQAYRNVPVHPCDRPLLGMQWNGRTYVDAALPFGLRSAPLIFSALADALQWIMERMGVSWVAHYIDDFITIGPPDSTECQENAMIMHSACARVGLPVEPDKDEGPATMIPFLGIELDSVALEVRLPLDKLQRLKEALQMWRRRKVCRKRDLLSLIGLLSHACKVVRAGRSFLRRLIDLSTIPKHLDHFVRLNADALSDIEWWVQYAENWNGVQMMRTVRDTTPAATVTSDASGKWGCGAYSGTSWFMLKWSGSITESHITVKEMVPVVISAAIWGSVWSGKTVRLLCDNMAVIHIVNHGTSKNQEAMHLARCLAFIAGKFDFHMEALHIKGADNILADALSRDNLSLFRSLYPQADREASSIPESLLDMLIVSTPDWTSKKWTELWTSTFNMA